MMPSPASPSESIEWGQVETGEVIKYLAIAEDIMTYLLDRYLGTEYSWSDFRNEYTERDIAEALLRPIETTPLTINTSYSPRFSR